MLCIVARTCSRGASFGMICRLVIGGGPPARCPAPGAAPAGGGCCAKAEDATTRPSPVASAAKRVMSKTSLDSWSYGYPVLRLARRVSPLRPFTCRSGLRGRHRLADERQPASILRQLTTDRLIERLLNTTGDRAEFTVADDSAVDLAN